MMVPLMCSMPDQIQGPQCIMFSVMYVHYGPVSLFLNKYDVVVVVLTLAPTKDKTGA